MSQYVYTMHRVSKIVPPKRQILKDISLSFFPGAKIGILGLNGSGKTTILRIMAGVDTDIDGDAIPMPNLTIGYLEQEPKLDPDEDPNPEVPEVPNPEAPGPVPPTPELSPPAEPSPWFPPPSRPAACFSCSIRGS